MFDMLDELGLPAAHNVNSLIYEHRSAVTDRIRKRGDEVVGHGRTNSEHQDGMWEVDEARLIADATATITKHEGKAPTGWMPLPASSLRLRLPQDV